MTLEEATQKVEETAKLALAMQPVDPRVALMLVSTLSEVVQEMLEVLNIYNCNITLRGKDNE